MTNALEDAVAFWARCPSEQPYLHPDDAAFLEAEKIALEEHGFHLELVPQPWVGPLRSAKAVVLQLNPGFSGPESEIEKSNPAFQSALWANMRGTSPNLFLRFPDHPGNKWVAAHFRGIGTDEQISEGIAQLELVPYHSQRFAPPSRVRRAVLSLPSVAVARRLVQEHFLPMARAGEVAVVVQRSSRAWRLDTEEENVIVYRGAECQGGWMTINTRAGKLLQQFI